MKPQRLKTVRNDKAFIDHFYRNKWRALATCKNTPNSIYNACVALKHKGFEWDELWVYSYIEGRRMLTELFKEDFMGKIIPLGMKHGGGWLIQYEGLLYSIEAATSRKAVNKFKSDWTLTKLKKRKG